MSEQRFLFIINPISGLGQGKDLPSRLRRTRSFRGVDYVCRFTEYAGHAAQLAAEGLDEGFTHIVAVGGDGTVNEVGRMLRGKEVAFGVVSLGSGNGFARHLGCSLMIDRALKQLRNSPVAAIDMVELGGHFSLNVSGVGFDAEVAHYFNTMKIRGIASYVYSVVRLWFRYPEKRYHLRIDGQEWEEECFILSIANSPQYGYNASIAPQASLQDGLVDICILKRPKYYQIPRFLYCFGNSKMGRLSYFREIQCREALIEGDISRIHIDGDPYSWEGPLDIRIHPGSLKVVAPKLADTRHPGMVL